MAIYAALKAVHLLSIMVWMGGMFFAHFCLRPAAASTLDPAQRVPLMTAALGRFFNVVAVVASLTLVSGFWMIGRVARLTREAGTSLNMPLEWWVMGTLGTLMLLVFGHIRFALYKRLRTASAQADWPAGAAALLSISRWVLLNLVLGTVIVAVVMMAEAG